ncbi:phosphoglycerate dehydrogenase [Gimesia maris]|uniref:D-3-phosphoglycerate dehydrogenase n=3 Tax=Gimesia maris TaxID=122 RepID=A0ABX5YFJ7_9PLAN|nr:phosphoglycerate dehydrogenase [Gimesia maris]EDL59078.1 D-3-phosphoglycerate dehydrogenase [Gimesia maris DSM 8797]QDT76898.1 D-3-phosphoglycerate dehydrogenase [Gimesia maris]QEG14478.1 D-3-phosphoglycerate dehydrogenase [Gimesia maris]QGQ32097.1 phosphoglycerate dehydrogenase [Gimesia maris]
MPRVICTAKMCEFGPHFEILQAAGFEVDTVPTEVDLRKEPHRVVEQVQGYDAVLAGAEIYSREVLQQLPDLKVISRYGVGFDAVDLAAADAQNIVVTITPGVNHHSVAEQAFALLMGIARMTRTQDRAVRSGEWERELTPRVWGSTIGIVGLGRIGQAVATRAIGMGMHVLAYDPFPNEEFAKTHQIKLLSLEELLKQSDYVTLHLPVTPETIDIINRDTLALMKPGSVLINTARGGLIDENALVEALESGHLRGAGLDVFKKEPLPVESPLIKLENVLLSCHTGGLDQESHRDAYAMAAQNIVKLHQGEWPVECVMNLKETTGWKWS